MKELEELEKKVKERKHKLAIEKKKEAREEAKERKKSLSFWAKEKRLYKKKLKIYKEILEWRDKFVKTKTFKNMFKGLIDDAIIIFEGSWGHKKCPKWDTMSWSRIKLYQGDDPKGEDFLYEKGELIYESGERWPSGPTIKFKKDSDEAVRKLRYEYLKEVHDTIKTGKVYKKIRKEIEEDYNFPDGCEDDGDEED